MSNLRTQIEKLLVKHIGYFDDEALLDEIMPLVEGAKPNCPEKDNEPCEEDLDGYCYFCGRNMLSHQKEDKPTTKTYEDRVAHPLEEGWGEKFESLRNSGTEHGGFLTNPNGKFDEERVKQFISQTLAQERATVLAEVREKVEKMKPVLWNDNTNRYLENIARYNTLCELGAFLTDLQVKK